MHKEILQKIGLTNGEIRVYEALIKLNKSSTGNIMKESGISSSKVYLILDKLAKRGFVSYIKKNNVKVFYVTNPVNILEYIKKKQMELEKTKGEAKKFVKRLTKEIGNCKEESAQIYEGIAGIRCAFQNVIDELNKNEEFLFFGSPDFSQIEAINFFRNLQSKRTVKEIMTKGIVEVSYKKPYEMGFKEFKNLEIKFVDIAIPQAIAIGKNRIIISLWKSSPLAFEIISKRLTESYREYFYKLWNSNK